jgi:hypothetical protein
MSPNGVCPKHGPYDGATCPYCSGGVKRPPAPMPLNEDDQPTDIGLRHPSKPASPDFLDEDEMPTNVGYSPSRGAEYIDDEAPTSISPGRRQRRFLDDDEETSLGRGGDDVTELYENNVPAGLIGILWVKEGQRRGKIYKIENNIFVGRKQGDIQLSDPKVSTPHAKFMIEEGAFTVWDCGSTNGTFVNGEKIRSATTLAENDVIKIGEMVFVLKVLKPD